MSNHDQNQKTRRTRAGRGHASRYASGHASPAGIKFSRLLRVETGCNAADDAASVTKVSRLVAYACGFRNGVVADPGNPPGLVVNASTFPS